VRRLERYLLPYGVNSDRSEYLSGTMKYVVQDGDIMLFRFNV
jgi:ribosome-binding ATPase YchF (GTP1/OBG family)